MPRTRARPKNRRSPNIVIAAEARGTSDILLYRDRIRATLRMSLQVYEDPVRTGARRAYFGEMFLTRTGQPEEFIGFIQAWRVDRASDDWIHIFLSEAAPQDSEDDADDADQESFLDTLLFIQRIYALSDEDEEIEEDEDGYILPREPFRREFAAPWARLNHNSDIIHIPMIWLDDSVCNTLVV
jgi:hypothetical protein